MPRDKSQTRTVVLTGATGTFGSYLIEYILANKYTFYTPYRRSPQTKCRNNSTNAEFCKKLQQLDPLLLYE